MKNQYFGDVNDYRKYGLLRCISEATGLSIGVLWMLTADDARPDGEFRNYLLDPHRWRHHDPLLYDRLTRLLQPGIFRNVDHADVWELVPNATYFNQILADSTAQRRQFIEIASKGLAKCSILFIDPDNGVEVKSVRYGSKNSCKYVYWHELALLFQRGHSLLVYQHYPRIPRETFESNLIQQFRSSVGASEVSVFSTPHVAFYLALQQEHAGFLPSIMTNIQTRWARQIQKRVDRPNHNTVHLSLDRPA